VLSHEHSLSHTHSHAPGAESCYTMVWNNGGTSTVTHSFFLFLPSLHRPLLGYCCSTRRARACKQLTCALVPHAPLPKCTRRHTQATTQLCGVIHYYSFVVPSIKAVAPQSFVVPSIISPQSSVPSLVPYAPLPPFLSNPGQDTRIIRGPALERHIACHWFVSHAPYSFLSFCFHARSSREPPPPSSSPPRTHPCLPSASSLPPLSTSMHLTVVVAIQVTACLRLALPLYK
jgi:hypothetical protein